MHCNFSRGQAFPMAFVRVSSQHTWFIPRALPAGSRQKSMESDIWRGFRNSSRGSARRSPVENSGGAKPRYSLHEFVIKYSSNPYGTSNLGSSCSRADDDRSVVRNRIDLHRGTDEMAEAGHASVPKTGVFSWMEASGGDYRKGSNPKVDGRDNGKPRESSSSMRKSTRNFLPRTGTPASNVGGGEKPLHMESGWRDYYRGRQKTVEDVEGNQESGEDDDPRWDRGNSRFRRWDGDGDWKKPPGSTVPKLIGEGIYGVSPVLSALLAQKRELFTLYVQEGMDLSSKNKRKDKGAVLRAMKLADKLGLSKENKTKHDLNMMVDSRPHQGLVLDASPLELIPVKELAEVEEGALPPVWVALDMITDPQNLGAIIRSAHFFGASGVVVLVKNSAPLSGVVSKASAGALESIELRSCRNMIEFLTGSSRNGWHVLGGSVSTEACLLNEVTPGAPMVLVLGNEGTGLRPLVEMMCSQLVRIPGNGRRSVAAPDAD